MDAYYPPGAFYFSVHVIGEGGAISDLLTSIDSSFQEVSGITGETGIEEVAEGGENRFKHKLPLQAKYPNLSLKRGVVTKASELAEWCGKAIGSRLSLPVVTQDIGVMLLNEEGTPSISWIFVNAYPVKWDISGFNSQENKILTETLEFAYNYFYRTNISAYNPA